MDMDYVFLVDLLTQSFVSCTVGIWMVGIMTIPFGIATGIFAFISGLLVKYVGRIPVFIAGTAMIDYYSISVISTRIL